ncbi:MAG: flagellar hook-associated protein FlgL [Desulforhopalus sp.]
MKVTDSSTFRLMQANLDRISNDLLELRTQGATGLKLNKPSDDPGAIRPVLTTRNQLQQNARYLETMGRASDRMAFTDTQLANVEDILARAQEIAINSMNSVLGESDLATLADEVGELKNQLLAAANTKINGKYIFAGYMETTVPFVANPDYDPALFNYEDVTTWPYLYQGGHQPAQLEIAPGEYIEVNLTGNELFLGIPKSIAENGYPDPINVPASNIDIFTVLTRLEEAIRAGNFSDENSAGGSIKAQLANLEIAADQNRVLRSKLATRGARIESAMARQEESAIDLEQILSRYQDADVIKTFNDIVQQETAFQAALDITSRVSQISILDYF